MTMIFLLSPDPSLEAEVQSCLEEASILTFDSVDQVQTARSALDQRPVLLVDTLAYLPPDSLDAEVICIGDQAPAGLPLFQRPLRKAELTACLSSLSPASSHVPPRDQLLPSPFAEFQRDCVHDLNNQFTTLQGNLMLLCDESDDPSLQDMAEATRKAIRIVEWMEWMGAGEFSAKTLNLQEFLQDFAPMFFRLRGRSTRFEVQTSAENPFIRKDPQRFLALLIVLVDSLPGEPETCRLSCGEKEGTPFLRCQSESLSPPERLNVPESAERWLNALQARLENEPGVWTLHFN